MIIMLIVGAIVGALAIYIQTLFVSFFDVGRCENFIQMYAYIAGFATGSFPPKNIHISPKKIDFPPNYVVGQTKHCGTKSAKEVDNKVHRMAGGTKKPKFGTKNKQTRVLWDQNCV